MRHHLREATRPAHEATEAAFAAFDPGRRDHYTRFLLAHASVVLPLEAALGPAFDAHVDGWRRSSPVADLRADLGDLGEPTPPALPIPSFDVAAAAGALYVVEGSRLGAAVLRREVAVKQPEAPLRYLSAASGRIAWPDVVDALEIAAGRWDEGVILDGALRTFALFRAAAEVWRPLNLPQGPGAGRREDE